MDLKQIKQFSIQKGSAAWTASRRYRPAIAGPQPAVIDKLVLRLRKTVAGNSWCMLPWLSSMHLQVIDAANAANEAVCEMEAESNGLQQENHRLQSAVRQLEVQVSELKAETETQGSALDSLEQILGRIERSAESSRDRSPLTGDFS